MTAVHVEALLRHDDADIAAERCAEDDVHQVDPPVELLALVAEAEFHEHARTVWVFVTMRIAIATAERNAR
jgi:hypothetical protein